MWDMMRNFFVVLCGVLVFASCAYSDEPRQKHDFFVVFEVESMDASNMNFSENEFPWNNVSVEGKNITTNACGFAQVTYKAIPVKKLLRNKFDESYSKLKVDTLVGEMNQWGQTPLIFNF